MKTFNFFYLSLVLTILLPINAYSIKISGIVKDERGRPLIGVAIVVKGLNMDPFYSASNGKFSFDLNDNEFKTGEILGFILSKDGYEPLHHFALNQLILSKKPIQFRLKKSEQSNLKISGYVETNGGKLGGEAIVSVPETGVSTIANEKGYFSLSLPENFINREIELRVHKKKYFAYPIFRIANNVEVKIQLRELPTPKTNTIGAGVGKLGGLKFDKENYYQKEGDPTDYFERAKHSQLRTTDFGSDSDVGFVRRYFSGNSQILDPFGYGWSHNYSSYIDLNNSTLSKVILINNRLKRMEFESGNQLEDVLPLLRKMMPAISASTSFAEIIAFEKKKKKNVLILLNQIAFKGKDSFVGKIRVRANSFEFNVGDLFFESFNFDGRLELLEERGKLPVYIKYNKRGDLISISDKINSLKIEHDKGLISKVSFAYGATYQYGYDLKQRLVTVIKNNDTTWRYSYTDANKLKQQIKQVSKDTITFSYNEKGERVGKKQNEGDEFTWSFNDTDSLKNISLISLSGNGEVTSSRRVSYNKFSKAVLMIEDGETLEYEIAGCGCRTLSLKKREMLTKYEYDDFGNLVEYSQGSISKRMSYDPAVLKVDTLIQLKDDSEVSKSIFSYNDNGTLKSATNGEKTVSLSYDSLARIKMLIGNFDSNDQKILTFEYNNIDKPITIGLKNVGTVIFTYKDNGEVDKIKSIDANGNDGGEIATVVMRGLQELIDLTNPVGQSVDSNYKYIITAPDDPCSCGID